MPAGRRGSAKRLPSSNQRADDRGEEYDPAEPVAPDLLERLSLVEQARVVIGEDGPYERARQRQRERREVNGIPAWFSADLPAANQ